MVKMQEKNFLGSHAGPKKSPTRYPRHPFVSEVLHSGSIGYGKVSKRTYAQRATLTTGSAYFVAENT